MIESLELRRLFSYSLFPHASRVVAGDRTSGIQCVAAGDFDGNGTTDLFTTAGRVLLNDGTGRFRDGPSVESPFSAFGFGDESPIAADFNGDGIGDLAGGLDECTVLLSRGRGRFHLPLTYTGVGDGSIPTVADVNRDGYPDMAFTARLDPEDGVENGLQILLNRGNGSFDLHFYPSPRVSVTGDGKASNGPVCAGDFNGDGFVDFFAGTAKLRTPIYFNDGHGGFSRTSLVPVVNGASVAGDFNRDHKADLIVNNAFLAGKGDGTFAAPIVIPLVHQTVRAVGDFNGDRRLDLALSSPFERKHVVTILLGRGNGAFRSGETLTPREGTQLVVADLNRDGRPDLVTWEWPHISVGIFTWSPDMTPPSDKLDVFLT